MRRWLWLGLVLFAGCRTSTETLEAKGHPDAGIQVVVNDILGKREARVKFLVAAPVDSVAKAVRNLAQDAGRSELVKSAVVMSEGDDWGTVSIEFHPDLDIPGYGVYRWWSRRPSGDEYRFLFRAHPEQGDRWEVEGAWVVRAIEEGSLVDFFLRSDWIAIDQDRLRELVRSEVGRIIDLSLPTPAAR